MAIQANDDKEGLPYQSSNLYVFKYMSLNFSKAIRVSSQGYLCTIL